MIWIVIGAIVMLLIFNDEDQSFLELATKTFVWFGIVCVIIGIIAIPFFIFCD
jgi:hypothetical protein